MGKVPGADHGDALELRPFPDAFGAHVFACSAGVVGVDVEVGDKTHGRDYSTIQGDEKQDFRCQKSRGLSL